MQTKLNPTNVIIWTRKHGCSWCDRAKQLLKANNISYQEKTVGDYPIEDFYAETQNSKTVPQIIFDGNLIGGFEQLQRALTGDQAKTTKVV